ncbi:hypothetical protein B0H17DRAFT_1215397 [Mycena rosella]|uniref:Uncharacterized protein n=1 Tax=Mycena rosella TaxID=1033263 RepID=A0AAD7CHE0_MYCRO|nr:hypothetical protein B0H17DRAFT_1215397 [Mycena rosella]
MTQRRSSSSAWRGLPEKKAAGELRARQDVLTTSSTTGEPLATAMHTPEPGSDAEMDNWVDEEPPAPPLPPLASIPIPGPVPTHQAARIKQHASWDLLLPQLEVLFTLYRQASRGWRPPIILLLSHFSYVWSSSSSLASAGPPHSEYAPNHQWLNYVIPPIHVPDPIPNHTTIELDSEEDRLEQDLTELLVTDIMVASEELDPDSMFDTDHDDLLNTQDMLDADTDDEESTSIEGDSMKFEINWDCLPNLSVDTGLLHLL